MRVGRKRKAARVHPPESMPALPTPSFFPPVAGRRSPPTHFFTLPGGTAGCPPRGYSWVGRGSDLAPLAFPRSGSRPDRPPPFFSVAGRRTPPAHLFTLPGSATGARPRVFVGGERSWGAPGPTIGPHEGERCG